MVRAGALGDLLLLRPAIFSLRAAAMEVGLLAPTVGRLLLGDGPGEVQEHLDFDHPGLAALLAAGGTSEASPVFGAGLRSYHAAIAVTTSADLVAVLRHFIMDVRVVAPHPEGAPASEAASAVHASVPALQAARALGGAELAGAPVLKARPEDEAAARALLASLPERFLALHPGSGSPRKNWPADRFLALAERLAPAEPFLVVEGPADEQAASLLREIPRACFASGLSLRALGALLARARLYLGNDSGVTHLAAAFGAPTLALFGPTRSALWAPLGPRVRVLEAPEGRMDALDVERVHREAAGLVGLP